MKLKYLSQILFFLSSLFFIFGLWACGGTTEDIVEEDIVDTQLRLNDNLLAPLAAKARITTKKVSKIKIIVMGELSVETNFNSFSKSHQIPIVGLYPDRENKIQIEITDPEGRVSRQDHTLQTLPIPENSEVPDINISINELSASEQFLFYVGAPFYADFIFDTNGKVRWYYLRDGMPHSILHYQARNSNLIQTHIKPIRIVDFLGSTKILLEGVSHHTPIELPDGNIVAPSYNPVTSLFDFASEFSQETKKAVAAYHFVDIVDINNRDNPYFKNRASHKFNKAHLNSIGYNASDDSLVFSFRNQDAIIKIDRKTKAVRWILCHHKDWSRWNSYRLTLDKTFTRGLEDFPYSQHDVKVLPNNNILLFDNGRKDAKNRAVEYRVDEKKKIVSLVWEYFSEDDHFSKCCGSVHEIKDTNYRVIFFPHFPRHGYSPTSTKATLLVIDKITKKIMFKATFSRWFEAYYMKPMQFPLFFE